MRTLKTTEELSNTSSMGTARRPKQKKKVKAMHTPMIKKQTEETLKKLVDLVDKDSKIFKRTGKTAAPPDHSPVKQRSRFIGVSKNGNNWQSLIVINNTKVYLGTYKSQEEAAVTFDFYSMVVHYK